MYSIKNLLFHGYWFSYVQPLNPLAFWAMLVVFGLMIVVAIILFKIAHHPKIDPPLCRGLKKIINLLSWMGILGFLVLFFRYEMVYMLSRRFLLGFWILGLIIWVILVIRYFLKVVTRQRQSIIEQERLKKYLP